MSKPLLNILIRSTDLEDLEQLLTEIAKSTYKNVRAVIAFTDVADIPALEKLDEQFDFEVRRVKASLKKKVEGRVQSHPENLQLNRLLDFVEDGFVVIVDSNLTLTSRFALSRIMKAAEEGKAVLTNVVTFHHSDRKGVLFAGNGKAHDQFYSSLLASGVVPVTVDDVTAAPRHAE